MNHLVIRIFLISSLFFLGIKLFSQADNDLSDPYNNWDGRTHWSKYMRYSAKYFGPNALPIPDVKNGLICENTEIMLAGEYHYNKQDPTTNLFSRIEIPIVKKRVNIECYVVPIEFYNTDSSLRIERRTFKKQGSGIAGGDIYVINNIQLFSGRKKLPDMALRLGLRTASGTNLSHARYTDAPGYFFDLSFGKNIFVSKNNENYIRMYCSGGFYCWQTNRDDNRQNDAYMFSAGTDYKLKRVLISIQTASYQGYIGNGDKPWVIRSLVRYNINQKINLESLFEYGVHDNDYLSVRLGLLYKIMSKQKDLVTKT